MAKLSITDLELKAKRLEWSHGSYPRWGEGVRQDNLLASLYDLACCSLCVH